MGTKMKGLLRGLRYISQIFDEKEPEMQIGFPTDVKHVAHIGWDGPSANKPSWMNEFKCPPAYSNGPLNSMEEVSALEETILSEKPKHKSRRSSSAAASPMNSPARKSTDGARRSTDGIRRSTDGTRRSTDGARRSSDGSKYSRCGDSPLYSPRSPNALIKQSRRDRSANTLLIDSPTREGMGSPANGRSTRRQQNSGLGTGSPARDGLLIPKHSRARKSKGSSKTSRTKDQNSSSGDGLALNNSETKGSELGQGTKTTAGHLTSVLEAFEKEG